MHIFQAFSVLTQRHVKNHKNIWKSLLCLENMFTENSIGTYNFSKGSTKRRLFPLVAQRRLQAFISILILLGRGRARGLSLWHYSSQPKHI